ncbi:unnamed protein product [Meganyctiphanes norvegica]|uniref:Aquaporin n=1 Tax=Meganyctiphanes norvegica TaxID=48144 RepID=A0AAV2Q914_MEGNR
MGKIKDTSAYVGFGDLKKVDTYKALLAELVGSLVLVVIGCGSCVSTLTAENPTGIAPTVVGIAFAFGVAVATMAQAVGHVSGCHINPAVTCGMLVARHISVTKALLYIIVQCLGGVVGAAILKGVSPDGVWGATTVSPLINSGQAFGIELVITFILVLVVFGVCDDRRNDVKGSAPLAIGLSITACHLVAVPLTGASMNPARTFGPSVIFNSWANHWVYWAGPILGGIIAAVLYTFVFRAPKPQEREVELDNINKTQRNYN